MMRLLELGVVLGLLAACGGPGEFTPIPEAQSPQYAPDDPCKGVVPQMCAY